MNLFIIFNLQLFRDVLYEEIFLCTLFYYYFFLYYSLMENPRHHLAETRKTTNNYMNIQKLWF